MNTQGQRASVAMAGTAFTGTPTWGWTHNDTAEVVAWEHSASTSYSRGDRLEPRLIAGGSPEGETSAGSERVNDDGLGNREQSSSGATDPVDYPWSSGTVRAFTANPRNQYSALSNPAASRDHDEDGNLTNVLSHALGNVAGYTGGSVDDPRHRSQPPADTPYETTPAMAPIAGGYPGKTWRSKVDRLAKP